MFDDFHFEQSDDGFGQCVVAAVSDASDQHVASGFGKSLSLSNGHVLHAMARMVDQRPHRRTSLADGLVEGVEEKKLKSWLSSRLRRAIRRSSEPLRDQGVGRAVAGGAVFLEQKNSAYAEFFWIPFISRLFYSAPVTDLREGR